MDKKDNFKYDGIINEKKFGNHENSSLRIMWLMKEPNLDEKQRKWSLIKFLGNRKIGLFKYKHWYVTWGFVIKSAWGILNGKSNWEDIPEAEEITDILDYIAVVNINKLGGGRSTDMVAFHSEFRNKKLYEPVLKQINQIKPDIVIGGGTLALFYENKILFNMGKQQIDFDGKNIWGCVREGRLWIDGYHPNQRRIKQDVYYDHIIKEIQSFIPGNRTDISQE